MKPISKNSSDAEIARHEARVQQASTKHLDTALSIFKGNPGSRRAKGTTFTLTMLYDRATHTYEATFQGPRGKTLWQEIGDGSVLVEKARAHVAKVPGATLTIYS